MANGAALFRPRDTLLDCFIPHPDVAERQQIRIRAPLPLVFKAATSLTLEDSALIRLIFRARQWLMGGAGRGQTRPKPLLEQARAWGWELLAELPEQEVVFGAAAQPWEADVVFRPISPATFAAFQVPGYVKIAWTLGARPAGPDGVIAHTETRVAATDGLARKRFRRYWRWIYPGTWLIRRVALTMWKRKAERLAKEKAPEAP